MPWLLLKIRNSFQNRAQLATINQRTNQRRPICMVRLCHIFLVADSTHSRTLASSTQARMSLKRGNFRLSMRHRDSVKLLHNQCKQLRVTPEDDEENKENAEPNLLNSTVSTMDELVQPFEALNEDNTIDKFLQLIDNDQIKGLLHHDTCRLFSKTQIY